MDSIDRKKLFVSACLTMALSLAVLGVTLHDFSDDFTASIAGTFLANVMTYAPGMDSHLQTTIQLRGGVVKGGQGEPGPNQYLEQRKQVRFLPTHNQGWRQMSLTVS